MPQLIDMNSMPAVLFYSVAKGFEYAYLICFFIKKYKYPRHVTFLAFMAASLCSNAASALLFPGNTYIPTLLSLAADIVILRLTTGDRLTRQLFEVGLTYVIFSLINVLLIVIVHYAFSLLVPDILRTGSTDRSYEPISMFITAFSLCALAPPALTPLLRRIAGKVPDFNNTYARFGTILLFPVIHVAGFLLYSDRMLSGQVSPSVLAANFIYPFLIMVSGLLVDIIVVICAVKLDRAETLREETRRDIIAKREYLVSLPDSADSEGLRKLRHDMANILLTSQGLIEAGQEDRALRLLQTARTEVSAAGGKGEP